MPNLMLSKKADLEQMFGSSADHVSQTNLTILILINMILTVEHGHNHVREG
jgi:hypothetical protein